jgi:GMP synthase-like glutamine amidotransferase
MKKEILIVRHFPTEGPGYFAEFLDRRGIPHRTVKVDQGEPVPESIADIPGLVLMGGPMSVNDSLPWIPKMLRLIRQAVAADVPVLGHCLGGQLMSKALAGACAGIAREFGWSPRWIRRWPVPGWMACPRNSRFFTGTARPSAFRPERRTY